MGALRLRCFVTGSSGKNDGQPAPCFSCCGVAQQQAQSLGPLPYVPSLVLAPSDVRSTLDRLSGLDWDMHARGPIASPLRMASPLEASLDYLGIVGLFWIGHQISHHRVRGCTLWGSRRLVCLCAPRHDFPASALGTLMMGGGGGYLVLPGGPDVREEDVPLVVLPQGERRRQAGGGLLEGDATRSGHDGDVAKEEQPDHCPGGGWRGFRRCGRMAGGWVGWGRTGRVCLRAVRRHASGRRCLRMRARMQVARARAVRDEGLNQ